MKPNPNFDEVTLRWWMLTRGHIKELVISSRLYGKDRGRWGEFSKHKKHHLRELCKTRREVHRKGTTDFL